MVWQRSAWRLGLAGCGCLVVLCGLVWSQNGVTRSDTWEGTQQQDFLEGPIVRRYQCTACHTVTDQGGTVGPILNMVGLRRQEEWLRRWLRDPNSVKPGTKMPTFPFSEQELELTVQSLAKMKRELHTQQILASDGPSIDKGRALFDDYDCWACHRVGDRGRFVGPDLTWVGVRKAEEWERIWLRDPPAFKPGTFMPNFHIPEAGTQHLAAYLHSLQGQENDAARQWEFMINFTIDNDAAERGEIVFKRLACWSCHGEGGRGGVTNPNAAPGHEVISDLKGVRDRFTVESLGEWIVKRVEVPALRPDAVPQPYVCPAYPGAVDAQELGDLYAYLSSLAPRQLRWKIK